MKSLRSGQAGKTYSIRDGKAIKASRDDVADTAPRIVNCEYPNDKIKDVIGSGGR